MPPRLVPFRADYDFIRPDGSRGGTEELVVASTATGWRIESLVRTAWPEDVVAAVDWELDPELVTRLLHIVSRERFTGEVQLELAVTGNGLLAHRRAPDGPTQVELGWGPNAELDYISAAFPTVTIARSRLAPGAQREVDTVQIGTADLVPTIVAQRLRSLAVDASPTEAGHQASQLVEYLAIDTGHASLATTAESGALLSYAGLLRLTWLETSK